MNAVHNMQRPGSIDSLIDGVRRVREEIGMGLWLGRAQCPSVIQVSVTCYYYISFFSCHFHDHDHHHYPGSYMYPGRKFPFLWLAI